MNLAGEDWGVGVFPSIRTYLSPVADGDTIIGTINLDWPGGDAEYRWALYDDSDNQIFISEPIPTAGANPISYTFTEAYPGGVILQAEYVSGLAIEGSSEFFVAPGDEPAQVSYNCSCDDGYPSKTLAQMREFLMIRLGFGAMVATPLPGMAITLNSFLIDAQEQIYRQYKVFRLERFFTWEMEAGVRFYDLDANADECTKKLDPRMLTWVGISQDDNFWRPLVCGIKPEFYYGDITSWPTHYEIRQCIEVWPAPSDSTWKLRVKGYFGLLPFAADSDVNTVDYEAIQLYALANAKAHYGQPDAANYMSQFQTYIRKVTAGSHHTRRYIPGGDQYVPPPLPVLTGYPGGP